MNAKSLCIQAVSQEAFKDKKLLFCAETQRCLGLTYYGMRIHEKPMEVSK